MSKNPLPIRAGISASRLYLPKESWTSLLAFLIQRFPHMSADIIKMRLARGDMVNAQGVPYTVDSPYPADSWLWYYREVEEEVSVPFEINILYQDQHLIVIDKPHFLASIPGGRYLQETALIRLRKMLNNYDISPIHRLDRDTAGLLLFCADPSVRSAYQTLFQGRDIKKVYECVAPFNAQLHFPLTRQSYIEKSEHYFTMQEKVFTSEDTPTFNSQTYIEIIQHNEHLGHYRLHPLTGKKHQLRVHMNGLGLPICHDEFYPELLPARAADNFANPLQLLARAISFKDPISRREHYFESQLQLSLVSRYFDKGVVGQQRL
ncbi:MAG: pseudouridine synthase [Pelistega sp.]|nr:pseudouridine synthase [Pelistega sp.]